MHLGCSSLIGRLTDLCTPPPQRLLYKAPDSLSLYLSLYTFYTVNVNNLGVHQTSTLKVCCASGTRQTEYQTVPQRRATPLTVILLFRSSLRERCSNHHHIQLCPVSPPTTIHAMRERDCVVMVVLSCSSGTRLHVSTAFLPAQTFC